MTDDTLGASFRDPSGFVFEREGVIYRQVNRSYAADYDRLLSSGLYDRSWSAGCWSFDPNPKLGPNLGVWVKPP